jgi:hypothetical protein
MAMAFSAATALTPNAGASRMPERLFEFHGLEVCVGGDWPELVDEVRRDFAWFERPLPAPGPRDPIRVRIERGPPDFDSWGPLESSFVTPRNVVYRHGATSVVDYFGRALAVYDRAGRTLRIQGEDPHLVHEAAYLFLLSTVGEHLDSIGLPRLHALGLSGGNGAVVVLLPAGGGKSTLALRALRDPGVRILSEDSPLLDRDGRLHPFPLRLGINPTDAASLPAGRVRRIERMEFHPKLVLDIEGYRAHVDPEPRPLRHIVIGRRALGVESRLEPIPPRAALQPLLRECVVGVGLYQGLEFLLQRGMRDATGRAGVAAMRAARCVGAVRRAQVSRLILGRDHDRNWELVRRLL